MKYAGTNVLKIMRKAFNYNTYLVQICLKNINTNCAKIIDFGAGIGTFSELLKEQGFEIECIETDNSQAEILKTKGFKTSDDINSYQDNSICNIISFNVFEHIDNDKEILERIYKKLKKQGIFFMLVPANSCLYSSFDKQLGHFRRYDTENLINLVKSCNFKIRNFEYFDSLGYILAYIYKIINRTGNISLLSILIFDKLIFPLSVKFDKIFNKNFGKNIILVLTKDDE